MGRSALMVLRALPPRFVKSDRIAKVVDAFFADVLHFKDVAAQRAESASDVNVMEIPGDGSFLEGVTLRIEFVQFLVARHSLKLKAGQKNVFRFAFIEEALSAQERQVAEAALAGLEGGK